MTKPLSILDNDAKDRAIEEALEAARRGDVVDHEIVMAWLERLAAGENPPLPI